MTPTYLALDVESGGLNHNFTSVLEYYFIILDENFNELASLHLLTKPDDGIYALNAKAMDVNRINLIEHDKVAIFEREAKTKLYQFLDSNTNHGESKLVWVGHNVGFDRDAVYTKLCSRTTLDKFCKYYTLDTGTVSQFLRFAGLLPLDVTSSLGALIEHFGVEGSNSHRAEDDIRATVEVLKAMKSRVQNSGLFNALNDEGAYEKRHTG